jgi:hypothetical protein
MTVKLPKPGHVPIIGRREETMACVYVIGLVSAPEPVKISACVNLVDRFDEAKRSNIADIKLHTVYWLGDLASANRVLAGVLEQLRPVRGQVFNVTAAIADRALQDSAKRLNIPLMPNEKYLKICIGPAGRRDNKIENVRRSIGMSKS